MPRNTATAVCQATHSRDPDRPRPAADGRNLCYGCITGVTRNLTDLPWLHAEVEASMPTQRPTGTAPVSGTRERGLPVNLTAGELASQVAYDLGVFATWVASDRGLLAPADPRVPGLCSWLTPHVDWLAASEYAAEVRDVLTELVGRAYRVIDPGRRPVELGLCVEQFTDGQVCEGRLWAAVRDMDDPRPSRIWCSGCDLVLTPEQWFRFGKKYQQRAAEIARDQQKCERIAS
ncbi:hypothetical protein FLW53_09495 [Microbispora sp. SCL1-1]|uniref:hypothetical protein n=1 Tax=unclassified Microbispora TaxID=2614687 RepID=UPI001159D342|nr:MULTISPECIES: hypothetical protein [unclassified Microbispora]NJP24436.1 hypothetical protein [Microbispora sp. CL1-1]TQS14584.1 hypothetical protein FLW53_09495 [Microbispora sp. SCL1-1]